MAKKKKSKSESTNNKKYSFELIGLLLILIGILGFGFGIIGSFIKKFAMFLVGEWWPIILVYVILIGVLMIVKRKNVKYFSAKFIGFYLVLLVVLILSHYTFASNNPTFMGVINATKDNYMQRISTISGNGPILSTGEASISIGGGFIGALFAGCFVQLFSLVGTIIVSSVIGIVGLILMFDLNLSDIGSKVKDIHEKLHEDDDDEDDDEEDDDEDYNNKEKEDDNKVVITSVEDLKAKTLPQNQEVKEEVNAIPVMEGAKQPYRLPSMSLLDEPKQMGGKVNSNDFIRANKNTLERVLKEFGFNAQVTEIHVGPAVTQYELHVSAGTKLSKIVSLNKEIALALAAKDVRIQAPIPGKSTIGIEIPNQSVAPVKIKEILASKNMEHAKGGIVVALGKDIMGTSMVCDITKMPHMLIAGSTGSGKSVCTNTIITSILMRYRPDEVKLILVDPKQVELSNYNGIPHLVCPVVTNPKKASVVLQKVVTEMDKRYNMFADAHVKKIDDYNEKMVKNGGTKMPYWVVIIDEMADLMIAARKEVEDSIMRITQLARAAGIHLITATQRPSTDVITGVVKANIPSRIAFAVASQIDSRTILDSPGAEKLLGKGDMLYLPMGQNTPVRIQGCFVSDSEVAKIIDYVCKEQVAQYDDTLTKEEAIDDHNPVSGDAEDYEDPLYDQIVEFAISTGKISASLVQRRFRLGYNRAARVIDLLEERGIIGPQNGSKPREVLVKMEGQE
ncbi:MAG: DUF87 domain-containing protein [Firmicutes bacterium]|nr:DUF87 domain-containing protein [Bacillota bacterium]